MFGSKVVSSVVGIEVKSDSLRPTRALEVLTIVLLTKRDRSTKTMLPKVAGVTKNRHCPIRVRGGLKHCLSGELGAMESVTQRLLA